MLQFQTYGRPFVKQEKISLAILQLGVNRKRLDEPELDLVQLLIKCRPSITYKEIKENIEAYSTATASISFIGRAVRDHLPEGKMTWKKMMRPAGEKFFFYLVNNKYFSLSTVMLQIKTRILKVGGLKLQFSWFYN